MGMPVSVEWIHTRAASLKSSFAEKKPIGMRDVEIENIDPREQHQGASCSKACEKGTFEEPFAHRRPLLDISNVSPDGFFVLARIASPHASMQKFVSNAAAALPGGHSLTSAPLCQALESQNGIAKAIPVVSAPRNSHLRMMR